MCTDFKYLPGHAAACCVFIWLTHDPALSRGDHGVLGDGSCSAQDGEEEEEEKGPGKKTKLQTSWNNLSRQKERGPSEAEEGSAINGLMKEDLCAVRQRDRRRRKC